jgi:hypothetical protein
MLVLISLWIMAEISGFVLYGSNPKISVKTFFILFKPKVVCLKNRLHKLRSDYYMQGSNILIYTFFQENTSEIRVVSITFRYKG